ncbi:MAG: hypothetical protein M0Q00_01190 [Acholeplasmataceae bacterium]|nr:hypothetical protein [Acholeplasmataceae bacterium]
MFIEWIQQLTPEFYVMIGFFVIVLIFVIIILAKIAKVNRRVGTQDFELLEAISKNEEDEVLYNITIVNKSFSSNHISIIGLNRLNVRHSLEERNTIVAPRNKYETKISMAQIEEITIINEKKYKKVKLFAENEVGLRKELNPKLLNKYLRKRLKRHLKQVKADAKQKRFDTGNYKFGERVGLLIKLLFRPFYKLSQKMKYATNRTLKESEVRRLQKAEHDKIKYKLEETIAKTNELKIREEAFKENKTRETELELLKQEKIQQTELLKKEAYEAAYEERKAVILAINPELEVKKYFEENPIDYEAIDKQVLDDLKQDNKTYGVKKDIDPKQTYLAEGQQENLEEPQSTEIETESVKEEPKTKSSEVKAANKSNKNEDKPVITTKNGLEPVEESEPTEIKKDKTDEPNDLPVEKEEKAEVKAKKTSKKATTK